MLPASALLLQMGLHHQFIDEDRCSCGDDGALREGCEYTQYMAVLSGSFVHSPRRVRLRAASCDAMERGRDACMLYMLQCIIARCYDAVSAIQLGMLYCHAMLYYAILPSASTDKH